jgi:hypothetical protein
VPKDQEGEASRQYRAQLNADGSPSEAVAAGYVWAPGTELMKKATAARAKAPARPDDLPID